MNTAIVSGLCLMRLNTELGFSVKGFEVGDIITHRGEINILGTSTVIGFDDSSWIWLNNHTTGTTDFIHPDKAEKLFERTGEKDEDFLERLKTFKG